MAHRKDLRQAIVGVHAVQRDVAASAALDHQFTEIRRDATTDARMPLQQAQRFNDEIGSDVRRVQVVFGKKVRQPQQILTRPFAKDDPCHAVFLRFIVAAARLRTGLGSMTLCPQARKPTFALTHAWMSSSA